jgi:hypothetical protein
MENQAELLNKAPKTTGAHSGMRPSTWSRVAAATRNSRRFVEEAIKRSLLGRTGSASNCKVDRS